MLTALAILSLAPRWCRYHNKCYVYSHTAIASTLHPTRLSLHHNQMSTSSVHADAPPEVVRDPEGLEYETGPQLGKGGFAICHRAKLLGHESLQNTTVALKIVKSKMEPPKLAQKVHAPNLALLASMLTDSAPSS